MGLLDLFRRQTAPAQTRRYDAASGSPRRFNGGASRFAGYGAETVAAGPSIRSRARHAAENNSLAASAIGAWVDAAIGPGIMPTSQHPDPAVRVILDSYFAKWAKRADASGRTDFWGLQAAAVRSERIDGESMLLWRGAKLLHLPVEQIAYLTTDSAVAGVELDDDAGVTGYWIHPSRPDGLNGQYAPPIFVPAEDALHIFQPSGPGQVRGVSALAPVLLALSELDATEDALITQTKIAALLSVILTNQNDLTGDDPLQDGQGLEPGAVLRLPGNYTVTTVAPQQSQQAGEFLAHLTRRIAAGVGVPVHLVDGNLNQANYSSLRAALVSFRQRIERYQFQCLVPAFLDPVWRRVATLAALEHGLDVNDDLFAVEHIPPAQPWVDPAKDAEATLTLMGAGLMSRRQAVASLGYSIEKLDAEIAADRQRESAMGLSFIQQSVEQKGSKA
ncbi:phage portal protein, lambda family [Gemmobacter aquatilis]|uniref:Phage portal protein, lambda family n=1 Tax=Gemmobacter aquatilis TaxID=933059 RepID=A0A1H8HPX3_9RHOB|nr:phage portal protein [Gemmobacter aquatilis]SEN58074.1 phage portal protein, lambda family [Gemmobacter aquatilis]